MISIIIPSYNYSKYISKTIQSIKDNSYKNFECIIIDDGSTDNSIDIIKEHIKHDKRFSLICSNHIGVGAARNIGLQKAKYDYILPIDADDLLMHDYINAGLHYLEEHEDCSLYYGQVIYNDGKFKSLGWMNYRRMLVNDCLCVSGIYRKQHALEVGGYNEELGAMEDYEFWIRYLYHNDNIYISDIPSIQYNIHDNSRHTEKSFEFLLDIRLQIHFLNKNIYDEYFSRKHRHFNTLSSK